MWEIPLTRGKVVIVDDDLFDGLNQFKWCALRTRNGQYYAMRADPLENRHKLYMHRELMQAPRGLNVHHRNMNSLDNRRDNLEVMSYREHKWAHRIEWPVAMGKAPLNLRQAAELIGTTRQAVLYIARKRSIGVYAKRHWAFSDADVLEMLAIHRKWVRDNPAQAARKKEARP